MLTALATPEDAVRWLRGQGVSRLVTDSRRVQPGDALLAWPGRAHDARTFAAAALQAGATACVVEAEGVDALGLTALEGRVATLPQLKAQAGVLAAAWWQQPSAALDVVAVTGTNGKTSTAWWLAQALARAQRPCGLVGTLGVGVPGQLQSTGLTTPDAVQLQQAFADLRDTGHVACAVEASSIGLVEHRLAGTQFAVAVFTNLSQDHLDYHGSMAAYWAAKRTLFEWPALRAAVLNVDDDHGRALAEELLNRAPRGLAVWSVGLQAAHRPRVRAQHLRCTAEGQAFELVLDGAAPRPVQTRCMGAFNVSNWLGVFATLCALGLDADAALLALDGITPVPGRLEPVRAAAQDEAQEDVDLPAVLVDYAHTPDALAQVLTALRPLAAARGGALWCVFGCGGNRDAGKRPLMGGIASRLADRVLLTSDNPRHEAPQAILAQIQSGIAPGAAATVAVVEDRAQAIAQAIVQAAPADVVLLAGKGHEDSQEVAGVKRPFLDAAHARQALQQRRAA